MEDHPSTIVYVMKNVAFIGIDTPMVLGILQARCRNRIQFMKWGVDRLESCLHYVDSMRGEEKKFFVHITAK